MMRRDRLAAALVAALLLALAAPAAAAKPVYSKLWGKNGELWDPKGRLPDFSYAGYKQGNKPVPLSLPVTRSVLDFKKPGMTDTQMLVAALAWAHRKPANSSIVLRLPAGTYTLTQRLWIKRSRLVLRGDGSRKTTLYIPKTLTQIYGPNPDNPKTGAYVNSEAFITLQGAANLGPQLATVSQAAPKGTQWITVSDARAIRPGEYYDIWWTDVGGRFNNYMFDNKWVAPAKYRGSTRVRFVSKVLAVRKGNRVKLERRLPYDISSKMVKVAVRAQPPTVTESGVEGLTFSFKWTWYPGHHLEKGYNAVQLRLVRDCWVHDIATVNADNTVLIFGSTSSTIDGVKISVTKTRSNRFPNKFNERADADGHWGCEFAHSFDLMIKRVHVVSTIMHSVGTDSSGKWSVFMDCVFTDGNLDLHRALAGPTLYTNIDVGVGTHGLYSGGPKASGPNALAGTTWWGIKARQPLEPNDSDGQPGDCSFGPVINLVGVNIYKSWVPRMCKTWWYERTVNSPFNLFDAQFLLRAKLAASAAAANATAA